MAEYIEREAAIEAAIDAADEWDGGYNPHRAAQIREGINYIPAADVRPVVRGKWIKIKYRSICRDCSFRGFASWNFCPNCGADMRGDQDV